MKNDLEKLKNILGQNATRWSIIKDTEEWLKGCKKELQKRLVELDKYFDDEDDMKLWTITAQQKVGEQKMIKEILRK